MVMKLVFTKSSPLNTTLVDKTSGLVMYEIETERRFLSKTTVIRKPFTSASFCSVEHLPSPPSLTWNLIVRPAGAARAWYRHRGCKDPVEDVFV
jgi:hypothetical protein